MTKSCRTYDIRLTEGVMSSHLEFIKFCHGYCKKWQFQLEEGKENKYRHWQCRVTFMSRKTVTEATKLVIQKFPEVIKLGYYIAPTSAECLKGVNFYCAKEDIRVEGPWTDKTDIRYVPIHIRNREPYEWQKTVLESAGYSPENERIINVIVDPLGNKGKSVLCGLARSKGYITIPTCGDAKELVATVCDMLSSKQCHQPDLILVDIPRVQNKKRLHQLMKAIEVVKQGWVYDMRYSFKEWNYDPPSLWIMSNDDIPLEYMSADRWKVYHIKDGKLVSKVSNV